MMLLAIAVILLVIAAHQHWRARQVDRREIEKIERAQAEYETREGE